MPSIWFLKDYVTANGVVLHIKGEVLTIRNSMKRTALKVFLGSAVVIGTVAVPLGIGVQSSGASSAFCTTLKTWETNPPKAPPSAYTTSGYHAWAKTYIPFYEKLAAEAPNATTAKLLNNVVQILKDYANASSIATLERDAATNAKGYEEDAVALEKAVIACFE